jgi:hypothetical protein
MGGRSRGSAATALTLSSDVGSTASSPAPNGNEAPAHAVQVHGHEATRRVTGARQGLPLKLGSSRDRSRAASHETASAAMVIAI